MRISALCGGIQKSDICVINVSLYYIKGNRMFNIIYSFILVSVVGIFGIAIANDISFYDAIKYIYYRM